MKRLMLVTVAVLMSSVAGAQSAPRVTEATFMKNERKHLEADTERRILEMLEQSRLSQEKIRLQTIENTSFNAQPAPVQAPAIYQEPQTVQVVPAPEANTTQTW